MRILIDETVILGVQEEADHVVVVPGLPERPDDEAPLQPSRADQQGVVPKHVLQRGPDLYGSHRGEERRDDLRVRIRGMDVGDPLSRTSSIFPSKTKNAGRLLLRDRPALFDEWGYFSRPEKNRINTMAHTAMR